MVRVPAEPVDTLAERLAAAVDDRTAAVLVSACCSRPRGSCRGLTSSRKRACAWGAELLVDAYHALGVVPFSVPRAGLGRRVGHRRRLQVPATGRGQLFPAPATAGATLRPVVTGWFAEFGPGRRVRPEVGYASGGDGSPAPPTTRRATTGRAVLDFFAEQGLTPAFLREVSWHQIGLLGVL